MFPKAFLFLIQGGYSCGEKIARFLIERSQ